LLLQLQLCKPNEIDLDFRKSRPKLTLEIFAYIFVSAALGYVSYHLHQEAASILMTESETKEGERSLISISRS
jgi:hypothetical protein